MADIRPEHHHSRCPLRTLKVPKWSKCSCGEHGWSPAGAACIPEPGPQPRARPAPPPEAASSGGPVPTHLSRPFFYREKANGVTLAVTYQGSDGLAFVAQPRREATEPYEQYGVVLPRDVARALALRMLASLQDPGSTDG
jgi:hypothetical protein